MNFITNLGQYLFYFKYLWSPADFTQFQIWVQNLIYSISQGAFGVGVLTGLDVTPGINLSINIAAGICLGDESQVMPSNSSINAVLTAPVGNLRWDLIVLRPNLTNTNSIPDPNNPASNVFLQQLIGFTLVDITGAESSNPSYPAKQDGDCVLCGVQLTPGQMSVSQSNIDYSVRNLPRKKVHPVRVVNASYNLLTTDDTVDANAAASGQVQLLPPASTVFGQDFLVTKIDTSANQVTVSGSDPIDGQGSIVLDSQWQSAHVRSVGTGWRVL